MLDPKTISEELTRTVMDTIVTVTESATENIIVDDAKDDEGREYHVIRDERAEPGKKVLAKFDRDVATRSHLKAKNLCDELRARQVAHAVIAIVTIAIKNEPTMDTAYLLAEVARAAKAYREAGGGANWQQAETLDEKLKKLQAAAPHVFA